jgi:hypothetical protein
MPFPEPALASYCVSCAGRATGAAVSSFASPASSRSRCWISSARRFSSQTIIVLSLYTVTAGLPLSHRRTNADARSRSCATVDTSKPGFLATSLAALVTAWSIEVLAVSASSLCVASSASAMGFKLVQTGRLYGSLRPATGTLRELPAATSSPGFARWDRHA